MRRSSPGSRQTIAVDDAVPACAHTGREPTVVGSATSGETVDLEASTLAALPASEASPAARISLDASEATAGHAPATRPAAAGGATSCRYVVVGLAGKGGMGVVHVAQDVDLLRHVALKALSVEAAHDRAARTRFVREVQVTAQLDHPHIVPVYSLEVVDGDRPAYAMKLVEGRTFAELTADTRGFHESGSELDEAHAIHTRLEHFLAVCDAVAYAHERGVVHRDLKPANLMVGAHHEVYVMDWGLCRLVGSTEHPAGSDSVAGSADAGTETRTGTVAGTPRYMSPEQARGEIHRIEAPSDQYSLGLILQELVTLRPANGGADVAETVRRAVEGRREPVEHAFGAAIAPELVAIIDRATAIDPAARYSSVAALANDLRRFVRGDAVEARPDTAWQAVVRRAARHRQAVALGVLAAVVVGLVTILALLVRHDRAVAREQRRTERIRSQMTSVTARGDLLEAYLERVRAEVMALAAATAQAAEFGTAAEGPLPWQRGPSEAATAGRGTGQLRRPAVPDPDVERLARRFIRTDGQRRRLIETLTRVTGVPGSKGVPIELRAGFANGLAVRQRGAVAEPLDDPRQEVWYRDAVSAREIAWSSLSDDHDDDGDGSRVIVAAPVRRTSGEVLGAIGLVLALDRVLDAIVGEPRAGEASQAAVVDMAGRLVGRVRQAGATISLSATLASGDVHEALRRGGTGVRDVELSDPACLVVIDPLHPTPWALVVVSREREIQEPAR